MASREERADAQRTRTAIARAAVSLATMDGLEGLSIGNLAAALDTGSLPTRTPTRSRSN